MPTKIEWTEETLNPIVGCTKISPACRNCYALRFAIRLAHNPRICQRDQHRYLKTLAYSNGEWKWSGQTAWFPERLRVLEQWGRPRQVFMVSMGDMFHESVQAEWITQIFIAMARFHQHTYQVLTKRPEWMRSLLSNPAFPRIVEQTYHQFKTPDDPEFQWPLPNVWLGVTAENQRCLEERLPLLAATTAALRFVSVEPILGPVDIFDYADTIDWVVCGAETGPGAREAFKTDVVSLMNQCMAFDIPFLFKRWTNGRRDIDGTTWDAKPSRNRK